MPIWPSAWPPPAAPMSPSITIGSRYTRPGIRSMRVDRRWLAIIILVSVAVRLAAAASLGDHIQQLPGIFDEISYHTLATRLLGGHGFTFDQLWWPLTAPGTPTAHWSYLYTLW